MGRYPMAMALVASGLFLFSDADGQVNDPAAFEYFIKAARELCASERKSGNIVTYGGEAGGGVSITLKRVPGANADLKINFTKKEWEGQPWVLPQDQSKADDSYKKCVQESYDKISAQAKNYFFNQPAPTGIKVNNPISLSCGASLQVTGDVESFPHSGLQSILREGNSDCLIGSNLSFLIKACPQSVNGIAGLKVQLDRPHAYHIVSVYSGDEQLQGFRPFMELGRYGIEFERKVSGLPVKGIGSLRVDISRKRNKEAAVRVCNISASS